ncbi:MAG TPA: class I adenylate-forming enzyme family protein [Woeseiaceae bacterium]|nr:class I adenylate-forming enzyme family protein [Woeseiaceae bacterium]
MTQTDTLNNTDRNYIAEWEARLREIEMLEFPANFRELLENAALQFGKRNALRMIDAEESLSFEELREQVNRLAASLYTAGVKKGSRVAVLLPNCIEFPVSWLAIAQLGAVMVPVNTAYTGSELDYVMNDAEVSFLIVHDSLLAAFDSMSARPAALTDDRVIVVGDPAELPYGSYAAMLTSGDPGFRSPEALHQDDLLNIQYTSGTTGFPKGCMQHQRYWIVLGCSVAALSTDIESLLTDHPYFYMDPQWQLVWALYSGATVNIAPAMSSSRFWQRVRDYDIHWAWFPVPILNFPETPGEDQHPIRHFHAGAISAANILRAERRFGIPVRSTYGMTEIGAGTLVPDEIPNNSVLETVGLRAPFRELRIVDENGVDVPDGTAGELIVRGDGVFLGYYKQPEANESGFYDDWFRTGDMFIRDELGYYHIVGRFKDMIRRSAENISAMEVEYVVMDMPEVDEAAAIPVADDYRGEEVKIYVRLAEGVTQNDCPPQKIIEHCAAHLAGFKIPRYYAYVDSFERTPSDKVAKHLLTEGIDDLRDGSYDRVDDKWR